MNKRLCISGGVAVLLAFSLVTAVWATDAKLFFSADKDGQDRVTSIREGQTMWIVVEDPDEDIDCGLRDKVWTDVKVMDAKTGAHIVWTSYRNAGGDAAGYKRGKAEYKPYKGHYPGDTAGWTGADFLEETGASTGLFVSSRAFQIGTRIRYGSDGRNGTHLVGPYEAKDPGVEPLDFEWGGYLYAEAHNPPTELGDDRIWVNAENPAKFVLAKQPGAYHPTGTAYLPPGSAGSNPKRDYILGRFENMDTLVGLYVDPNDPKDVALAQLKITDTQAAIAWDRGIYKDPREAARVTVSDPDENLNCSAVEYVPVFILINPGSWNYVQADRRSATNFCMLKRYGGVENDLGSVGPGPIVWYNVYNSGLEIATHFPNLKTTQPLADGTYFVQYPKQGVHTNVFTFDTASQNGITRVMFYAEETGQNTGIFELDLNNILRDLGFNSLGDGDVLAAYYLDPNDQDDFSLATATIEERRTSVVRFTDAARKDLSEYWIGRDPVYIEVVDPDANVEACCPEKVVVHICDPHEVDDSEWLLLNETSSNSPKFFTDSGMKLRPVWDALGIGIDGANGGYQLEINNWRLEGFNEDSVYVRYNDVTYTHDGLLALGDPGQAESLPPTIDQVRVENDVSFDLMRIGDTQVFRDGVASLQFLDRQGNRVSRYVNSDAVFIEISDPDQDEDRSRREQIDAFWDGTADNGQNLPFGPMALRGLDCGVEAGADTHPVNDLLGQTNLFDGSCAGSQGTLPHLYVLNPRNGRWAAVDVLETDVATGKFVSVICIDLTSPYPCVPSLGALPGDTILAAYQDPSNHSDVAWAAIKVAAGSGTPAGQGSSTMFTDAEGNAVSAYTPADLVFVKVVDPSHSGAPLLVAAVKIKEKTFDLSPLSGASATAFITQSITLAELGAAVGDSITATYTDPSDSADTSSDTVPITSAELFVKSFLARPNPFRTETIFTYKGTGIPKTLSVTVYDLAGHVVWEGEASDTTELPWDGKDHNGEVLANGAYIYIALATDGEKTFSNRGKVFIYR